VTGRRSTRTSAAFARFLAVGLSNTAVSFLTYLGMLRLLRTVESRILLAQLVSYAAGIAWSYVWNRRWTFASRARHGPEMSRFVASQLAFMLGSALVLSAVVERTGLHPTLAWCLVMALVTVLNFLVLRLWVFPASDLTHQT
jgi:putative flippase GtrA